MRFYKIIITNPETKKELISWRSTFNKDGTNNPGALNIELDFPIFQLAQPAGSSFLKIYGIGINQISQSNNYNNMFIQVYAGMAAGLPLANPKQAGLILEGTIFQCFGNWSGTDQNLNFQIYPNMGTSEEPKNIVLNWKKGDNLGNAIRNTLSAAFPDYKINIQVNTNLVLSQDEHGFFQNATQFAKYIKEVSQHIIKDNTYQGVTITVGNNSFDVFDGSSQNTPIALSFLDLVGQPIWESLRQIKFSTVLRADLNVGDYIQFPKTLATQTPQSFSQFRDGSVFQGTFMITSVRHLGNSRGLNGTDWISIYTAVF